MKVAPNALKVDENDFNISLICQTLDELVSALCASEFRFVKANTVAFQQDLKHIIVQLQNNGSIDVDKSINQCEQLSLRVACFPTNDPDRRIGLMASEFAKKLIVRGHMNCFNF